MTILNIQPSQDDTILPLPLIETEPKKPQTSGDNILIQLTNADTLHMDGHSQSNARVTPAMFKQKFNGVTGYPIVAELPVDFIDNLKGIRQGNMSPHMYNIVALPFWEKVTADPNYYPALSDSQIIEDNHDAIKALGEELRKRGDITYVEMGVGSNYGLDHKTIPMLRALGATDIGLLDYSDTAISQAMFHLLDKAPDVKRHALLRNFNTQSYGLKTDGPRVFALMGCTLGNFEGPAALDVPGNLSKTFTHYRSQMNKGDILILSVDHNLNPASLNQAYNTSFDAWVQSTKLYLTQEFGFNGYKAEDFDYYKFWDAKNRVFMFGFTPNKDGAIKVDGRPTRFKAGTPMVFLNSRRFTQDSLNEAYQRTVLHDLPHGERKGLELINVLPDRQKHISLQVLRAT